MAHLVLWLLAEAGCAAAAAVSPKALLPAEIALAHFKFNPGPERTPPERGGPEGRESLKGRAPRRATRDFPAGEPDWDRPTGSRVRLGCRLPVGVRGRVSRAVGRPRAGGAGRDPEAFACGPSPEQGAS